ncbi:MAG: hypothetical protein ACXWPM_00450 [Bdellovibrionota bacterium]
MSSFNKNTALAIGLAAGVISCSNPAGNPTLKASPGPTYSATEIDGTWSSGCNSKSSADFTFSGPAGNAYRLVYKIYADASCQTLNATVVGTGTFALSGAASAPTGAKKIDYISNMIVETTTNGYGATVTNCTGVTFQDNVTQIIAGVTCGEGTFLQKGQAFYSIYQLSGTTMQIGSGPLTSSATTGSTDANRTTTLLTTVYTKQ